MTIINHIVVIGITILFLFVALPFIFELLFSAWGKWQILWEDIFTK